MNSKNCLKDFLKYSSLNVLGMLGLSCYILADTLMIATVLKDAGLTALSLAIPIFSLIQGCGLMIGIGGGTKYSMLKSQHNNKASNQVFTTSFMLALSFALVFFLLGLFFSTPIVTLLGADTLIFPLCKTYVQIILLAAPFFLLNNVLLCFVRNDGAPQLAMIAMLIGSGSNILLDYIFMFPLDLKIFGAVLATALAPVISMIILLPFLIKKKNHFHFTKFKLSISVSKTIFSIGFPSLVTEVSCGLVILVFNSILLNLVGNIGVAAYGVIANLSLVVLAIYTGIAQGIQPIISYHYGSNRIKQVQKTLQYAVISVFILSGVIYFFIYFGRESIVSLFNQLKLRT